MTLKRRVAAGASVAIVAFALLTASASALTLDPTSYDFGKVRVGATSPPATFTLKTEDCTLTMTCDDPIPAIAIVADPETTDDFDIVGGTCGPHPAFAIASPGGSPCTIEVTFRPHKPGRATGKLFTSRVDPNQPPTASLTGIGSPRAKHGHHKRHRRHHHRRR